MKEFTKTYEINAPISATWDLLTNTSKMEKWSGGKVVMDLRIGGTFELWDKTIHGINTKIIPEVELHQDWFGGDWKEPSKVIFLLTKLDENKTRVMLTHSNLPDDEADDFNEGWDEYYMVPLKKMVENQALE